MASRVIASVCDKLETEMNIVVIDYACIAGEADFPPLSLDRYGWEQFPGLSGAAIAERGWRADVIVTCGTPLTASELNGLGKLRLVVVAGDDVRMVDQAALRARNIALAHVPGLHAEDPVSAPDLCRIVVENIEAFIQGKSVNRIL